MPSGKRVVGKAQWSVVDRIAGEMGRANGMRQSELARKAGVPETTLSKILNGDSALDVEQAGAIAAVFGLDLWQLVAPVHVASAARARRRPRKAS